MKQFIRDYLTFNKRERNGIVILISIIVVLLIYLNISDKFIKQDKVDFSKFENQIIAFNEQSELTDSFTIQENFFADNANVNNVARPVPQYFEFNPNNLDEEDWKKLGLTDKQIQTIKNYEAKGGQFRTKEDVKKMYCITALQYAQLEPYISIPPKSTPNYQQKYPTNNSELHTTNSQQQNTNSKLPTIVELNSADSAYLTKVKGIGAFYAKSIIKYRQQLGGFAFKEQLMEIWKFDQEKFDAVKDYIIVDESEIKKININNCTAEQLKHPYLSWNAVNAIVNYRKQHGKFKKLEEIKNTDLVDDETYRKIVVYLTL